MEIRKLTVDDDIDAISRIYAVSWKSAYKGIVPQEYRWSPLLANSPYTAYYRHPVTKLNFSNKSLPKSMMKNQAFRLLLFREPSKWEGNNTDITQ